MDPLIIKPTNTTFMVYLDKAEGRFEFSGRSRPENVMLLFESIFEWFKKYEVDPNPETIINFKLEYFNSSSAKVLLRFFANLEEMRVRGMNMKIVWHYRVNDDDMLEAGEDFASLIDVPFEFVALK